MYYRLHFLKCFELKIHKSSNYTSCLQQQCTVPPDMQGTELCCVGARSTLQSKFVFICMAARQFVSFNLRTCVQHPFPLSSISYTDTANHCQSTGSYAQTLCTGTQFQMVMGGKPVLNFVHSAKSSLIFLPSSKTKLKLTSVQSLSLNSQIRNQQRHITTGN